MENNEEWPLTASKSLPANRLLGIGLYVYPYQLDQAYLTELPTTGHQRFRLHSIQLVQMKWHGVGLQVTTRCKINTRLQH